MKGRFIVFDSISLDIQPTRKIKERIVVMNPTPKPNFEYCSITLDTALTIVSDPITRMNNYKELIYKDYRLMNMMYAANRYINYVIMRDDMINRGSSYIHQGGFIDTIANQAIPYFDDKKIYHDAIKFGIDQHVKSCREVLIPDEHFFIYMDPKELVKHLADIKLVNDITKVREQIEPNVNITDRDIEMYKVREEVFQDVLQTYERVTGDPIHTYHIHPSLESFTFEKVTDEIWSKIEPLFQKEK